MISSLLTALAVSVLQPGDPWPESLDTAFGSALDSIGITRQQLDFDRHWATSVHLADSTVILAIQSIESLPVILEDRLTELPDYRETDQYENGMDGLGDILQLLEEMDSRVQGQLQDIPSSRRDSLLQVLPDLWLSEDDPMDWESVLDSLGLAHPASREMDMDSLAALLDSCSFRLQVPRDELVEDALALRGAGWPGELSVTLPGVTGSTVSFCFDGPVRWVIGGSGRNVYTRECPFELIIDVGGDDLYGDGIGGALGPAGKRVSVVIDLQGDDTYSSSVPVSQGCGIMGFGALIDLQGNDSYTAADFSQGAGLAGQGILVDLCGDDTFRGGTFSQGAGCFGTGFLFDGDGDDFRKVDLFGQGFGGPRGNGTLVDRSGSDCYLAGFRYSHAPLLPDDNQAMSQGFAMGIRPLVAGGWGLLADYGSDNDTYRAEVFGQGSAYFYGLGMLYDQAGQDVYQAAQYSQGSGIHLASGVLWDGDGDDSYFSRYGPAQGSAHDLSTGFLCDGGGNDWYCSDGGQSLSLTNSASIFIDAEGSDTYCARGGGQGEARWARGSSGAAVFIDLADDDFYTGPGADSSTWQGKEYGVGTDVAAVTPGGLNPQDPVGDPESLDMDSLFAVASEWGVGPNVDRVRAHREELAARGREAVEYLIRNHMGTLSGLESRAMEKTFRENHDVSVELLLQELDRIHSLPPRNGGNIVYFLGKLKDPAARVPLQELLSADAENATVGLTVGVIKALGSIGDPRSVPAVISMASDSSERVRRECAVSLGEICSGEEFISFESAFSQPAIDAVRHLMSDSSLSVRSAAEHAMELIEESSRQDSDAAE